MPVPAFANSFNPYILCNCFCMKCLHDPENSDCSCVCTCGP